MLKIKNLAYKLLITGLLLFYAAFLYAAEIQCPFYSLTGLRCFGCGMTRAWISVLQFDFHRAFSQHLMFWSVPLLYLFFLYDGRLFRKKWLNILFCLLMLTGFVINLLAL